MATTRKKAGQKKPHRSIALLLGAGASAPLGYRTLSQLGAEKALGDNANSDMRRFAANLDHFLVTTEDVAGIEAVIDRLDVYISFLKRAHLDRNCTEFLFPGTRQQHGGNYMLAIAEELRQILLRRLYEEYSKNLVRESHAAHALKKFYVDMAERAHCADQLQVFTTNYDVALEKLADRKRTPERVGDDATRIIIIDEHEFRVTHLHGCVAWRYTDDDAAAVVEGRRVEMKPTGKLKKDYERMVIKTGIARAETKLDRHPFSEAYSVFRSTLRDCSDLITIGVGFRDRDLVRDIVHALKGPSDLQLLVVEKSLYTANVISRLRRHGGGPGDWEDQVRLIRHGIEDDDCLAEVLAILEGRQNPNV